MKSIAIITALTFASQVLAQVTYGPVTPLSPEIVDPANGYTYLLLSQGNWTDSEAEAVALGGHLATINNQAEQEWVYDIFGGYGGQFHALWIGLSDAAQASNYVWSSGAPLTYTDWSPGQPNDAGGDFVAMYYPFHIGVTASQWSVWGDGAFTPLNQPFNGVVEIVPESSIASLFITGYIIFLLFIRYRPLLPNTSLEPTPITLFCSRFGFPRFGSRGRRGSALGR